MMPAIYYYYYYYYESITSELVLVADINTTGHSIAILSEII